MIKCGDWGGPFIYAGNKTVAESLKCSNLNPHQKKTSKLDYSEFQRVLFRTTKLGSVFYSPTRRESAKTVQIII